MKIWNLPLVEYAYFQEIEPSSSMLLVTTPGAWEAAEKKLEHLKFDAHITIPDATVRTWTNLTANLMPKLSTLEDPVIYAVGGGLAIDAAKFIAHHTNLPLVGLPTALSVDAFFTWASGVRHDGCVEYVETKPANHVILDFEVIAAAPPSIRAAGICDVLSIATGLWDWEFAEEHGKNPPDMPLILWAAEAADAILQGALECAEAAGQGDPSGLKQLADCLAMEVQLCNQIGHSRPEEGSEHYFAYLAENFIDTTLPHGNLVGPAILKVAQLQGENTEELEAALRACNVPLDSIPAPIMKKILDQLPTYVNKHELPFGIAHSPEHWESA